MQRNNEGKQAKLKILLILLILSKKILQRNTPKCFPIKTHMTLIHKLE